MANVIATNSWVVVDCHLWVDYFHGKKNSSTDEVDRLIEAERPCMVGPVLYEILVGPKNEGQRQYLLGRLQQLPLLETRLEVWMKSIALGKQERIRKDNNFPLSDVLIAAHCIVHRCALFTRDAHFDVFGELKRHRL